MGKGPPEFRGPGEGGKNFFWGRLPDRRSRDQEAQETAKEKECGDAQQAQAKDVFYQKRIPFVTETEVHKGVFQSKTEGDKKSIGQENDPLR